MKNKPAPLLNPGTLQPMTAKEPDGVFCDELVQQELDGTTAYIPIPDEIREYYRMYRPSPLCRAYRREKCKKIAFWSCISHRIRVYSSLHPKRNLFAIYSNEVPSAAKQQIGEVRKKCNSDDRRLRRKQGGAVGAAVSRTRVPPKARSGRWAPQPVLAKRLAFFHFDFLFGVTRGE